LDPVLQAKTLKVSATNKGTGSAVCKILGFFSSMNHPLLKLIFFRSFSSERRQKMVAGQVEYPLAETASA
jgi:hypothetical protein